MKTKVDMECTASSQTAGRQAVSRVEAAMAAVTLPLMRIPPRSTTEQREALLQQLYTNYAELQSQRHEIENRKRFMDFDMYQSNQQDIHDLLFANADAADGALGDWDTWERVESVVKRYAYGRPWHTAQEKKEVSAMQSRIDALNEGLQEKAATMQSLTESHDAALKELAGVRKLLHLKDNEIRLLSNQHSTAKVQLRCVERERAALRGFCSEEPSALKEDLRFLIEANQTLERANLELRRRLHAHDDSAAVARAHRAPAKEEALDPSLFDHAAGEPTKSAVTEDSLDACVKDDAYRHKLLSQRVPLSGMYIDARRKLDQWQRRLEAEVRCAMGMLDQDALQEARRVPLSLGRGGAHGSSPVSGDTFVSYATYQSANRMQPSLKRLNVVAAPQPPSMTSAPAAPPQPVSAEALGGPEKARSETTPRPSLDVALPESAQQQVPKKDRKLRSVVRPSRPPKTTAIKGVTAAPGTAQKASVSASASVSRKSETTNEPRDGCAMATTAAPGFVALKSAVLRCAELSRAHALRRELLHTQWLRHQLQEERERVSSLMDALSHSSAQYTATTTHDLSVRPVPLDDVTDTNDTHLVSSVVLHGVEELDATLPPRESSRPTSTAHRLRHLVQESRPPTGECDKNARGVRECPVNGAHDRSDNSELLSSSSRLSGAVSRALSVRASSIPRNLAAQPLVDGDGSKAMGVVPVDEEELRLSAGSTDAAAAFWNDGATPALLGTHEGEGAAGDRGTSRLALHAGRLRQAVQQLALDAAAFRSEVREAFHVFGTLIAEQQSLFHRIREAEKIQAAKAAALEAVEEAAVARVARLLEEEFNFQLSEDCYAASPASLPDTATDEEWLAHELRLAAVAMVREKARSQAMRGESLRQYDAEAAAPAAASEQQQPCATAEANGDGIDLAQQFFYDDILRRIHLRQKGSLGTARRWNAPGAGGRVDHRGVQPVCEEDVDVTSRRQWGACAGQRSPGGAALPMQWYWEAGGTFGVPLTGAVCRGALTAPRRWVEATGAESFVLPTLSPWRFSTADIQSIRPTVLRYDFGTAARQGRRQVNAQVRRGMTYICGKEFYDFVREYVVPIIASAARVRDSAMMDAALRSAVRELRERARRRCKRGVRLLLERVANNIRTRHLLRGGVFHGEGFVSYVGVLYSRWRHTLEQERRRMRTEHLDGNSSLLSLMHLQTPYCNALAPTTPPLRCSARAPGGGVGGSGPYPHQHSLQKSSYHFDEVNFGNK
ncbi:hypothetical protein LSCM1_05197 [Leishmania martiniquensis]|uniref:Uncharacterized protein n=1 Tax=Leishmania martiniquensis TaxID=1580590 RepID=A0A836H3E5_9TRYP|nr:hypothetical protein LSCM1_05197 [Leishmania martiniquensis]